MKKHLWAVCAAALMAAGLILRFAFGIHYPAYALGGVSAALVLWHFHKNLPVLVGILTGSALFLRFALRGYAWWGYALLFVAVLLLLHRYLPVALWRVVVILVCIGLAYFCFVEYFIIKNARTDKDVGRDYLIVLGAAVYGDQPSLTLVRRLEGTLDYLNEHPDTVAIVSGGMGKGETVTEAHIIRARGDEPQGNVAIVSSAYHLYRAKLMAKSLGVPDAAGVAAPWGYFFVMLNYFIREAFGVTHLWVLGS